MHLSADPCAGLVVTLSEQTVQGPRMADERRQGVESREVSGFTTETTTSRTLEILLEILLTLATFIY